MLIHRLPFPSTFPSVLAGNMVYLGNLFLSAFSHQFNALYSTLSYLLPSEQIHRSNASNTITCHVFNFALSSGLHHHFATKSFQFFLSNVSMIQLFLLIHLLISLQAFIISYLDKHLD